MKSIIAAFAMIGLASAHNRVTHFHINGVPNSDCVRQGTTVNPITDVGSSDMACNTVQGNGKTKCVVKGESKSSPIVVEGGDSIAFEWRSDPGIPPAEYPLKGGTIPVGVTDDSHKGPCTIYMKKVDDALTASAPGDGWFKVTEDGLDSAGTFCTDRLRKANAPQPGVVPKNIPPGDYLYRAEILTLNNAGPANMGGAEEQQFYVSCVQVTVEGTSGNPDVEKVSIPGYLTKSSPGMVFDIWNSETYSNYPIPGPKPLTDNAGSSPGPAVSSPATPVKSTTASAQPTGNGGDGEPVPTPTPTTKPSVTAIPTGANQPTTFSTLTTTASQGTGEPPLESAAPSSASCSGRRHECRGGSRWSKSSKWD
ncbi:unnamed protein product [Tuber aestivum]|uniref:AA9 family lytic polysaccharide monooxygenase n=1 Tax=Tuber aestivum TaxID=59557 RepID=A0A292PTB6_9PEZI|nr:unnamed protein product [Tuber aestivum]